MTTSATRPVPPTVSTLTLQDFEAEVVEAIADKIADSKVKTFSEAHVLTTNRGLVVKVRRNNIVHEFQLTIVRSKGPADNDEDGD